MSLTEHEATVMGTLDAVREAVENVEKFIRRRTTSRSGVATFVNADTRKVELLPANRLRHMAVITNDSTATMYLALAPNANTDEWTYKLAAGDTVETPAGYTGPITAIWSAQNGAARITELA